MPRKVRYVAIAAVVVVAASGAFFLDRANSSQSASAASATTTSISTTTTTSLSSSTTTTPSGSTPTTTTTTTAAPSKTLTGFYLDMGASASLGFQPTGILHHNGHRTNTGYANDLLSILRFQHVSLTLDQIGCPGDTVQTILNTTKNDHCYKAPNTQLTKAVAYLQANHDETGLVTLDLGFNNIRLCLAPAVPNEACVAAGIAAVQVDMPKILKIITEAAGPHVTIVGLEYTDPWLAHYFNGPSGPAEASETLVDMNHLNAVLGQAFTNAHVAIADVPALAEEDNSDPVALPNVGDIPANVEETCSLTWMCYTSPFGPDDHPNDAGYSLIAQAIAAELPKSW
jgi:GDSL-like Lipase/Acylhydrolase family